MASLGALLTACGGEAGTRPPETETTASAESSLVARTPGQGVISDEGRVLGPCIRGQITDTPIDHTELMMDIISSRNLAYERLSGRAGLSWRTYATRGDARAAFAETMVETDNAFSVVLALEHRAYESSIDTINGLEPTIDLSHPRFPALCGDSATGSVTYGGRALLNIRYALRTSDLKKSFRSEMSAAIGRGAARVSGSAELERLTQRYAGDLVMSVTSFQDGGGSVALGSLFNGTGTPSDAAKNTVACAQSDLAACLRLTEAALVYFNDPATAASLSEHPVAIDYEAIPWSRFNITSGLELTNEAFLARRSLEFEWDNTLDIIARMNASRALGSEEEQPWRQVHANTAALEVATRECVDRLNENPSDPALNAACIYAASAEGLASFGFVPIVLVDEGPTEADWAAIQYHHKFEATSGGDANQCNGGLLGTERVPLGQWTTASRIDADDRPGGCQDSYGVEDPANVLKGLELRISMSADGDAGQCPGAGDHLVPISAGGSEGVVFSDPLGYDTDGRSGGCQVRFSVNGRNDIAWDIEFVGDGDGGQCGGAGSYTIEAGGSAQIRVDTDGRPGGCRLRSQLRRK